MGVESIFCPKCGQKNDSHSRFCVKCGNPRIKNPNLIKEPNIQNRSSRTNKRVLLLVGLVLRISLGLLGIFLNTVYNHESTKTEPIIQISESSGFPSHEAPALAYEISKYDGKITSIKYKGLDLNKKQCLYIMARAITMINQQKRGYIPILDFGDPPDPYGRLSSAVVERNNYQDMALRTYQWMENHGRVPNHIGIYEKGSPDLSPDLTFKLFMKVLTEYRVTGKLPSEVSVV